MTTTMKVRRATLSLLVASSVMLLSAPAYAQSAITGMVTDETGGVLPGVTVEAASPALIEQVRTAVTDAQGRYSIVDLRPGTYAVTFTLLGFASVVREGVQLPANFTATINIVLGVGGIEESLTVSGVSPVVDVQSASRSQVMSRELIESVPSGRSLWAYGQTIPSIAMARPDVGGTSGTQYVGMSSHGSFHSDNRHTIDGVNLKSFGADGNWTMYYNIMMFQEISYETSSGAAETQGSGVGMNLIPKEGGNTFSGLTYLSYLPGDWGSDNVTDELRARGLRAGAKVDRVFDYNPSLGGPILRDRLWFFGSFRRWGSDTFLDNAFANLDPTRRTYRPDVSRQVIDDNLLKSGAGRVTLQLAQQHKFGAYLDRISKFRGHEGGPRNAEEATGVRYPRNYYAAQAKYTATLSSRLLLEGGFGISHWTWSFNEWQPDVSQTSIPRVDRALGTTWGARTSRAQFRKEPRYALSGSLSYVTGSHAFKTGIAQDFGSQKIWAWLGQAGVVDLIQEYRNGVPESVEVFNTPWFYDNRLNSELAVYAQDAWTIDRLTLRPGLRVEWLNTEIFPAATGAGRFVPARNFAREECMPCWGPDVSPRLSAAYDLFGDARTAVKASVGKYVRAQTTAFALTYNPMRDQSDRRTWRDLNGDDIAQDNEIGPVNVPFDIVGVRTRNPEPDLKRSYQWEYSAGVQHELVPGVSLSATWMRRTFRNLTWADNLLVSQSDYTSIPVQNPIDPSERIPVYSLDRAKLGKVDILDRNSDKNRRWNTGLDVDINARIRRGSVFGGISWDKQVRVTCEVDDPNQFRFCDQSAFGMPYRAMFKVAGTYPLPYGVEISGSFQSYPGGSQRIDADEPWQQVNYQVTRSILPALTQSSVTVPLIQPGTKYLPRWNQGDLRLTRLFEVGNVELRPQFDIYNFTNSNSILAQNQTYGSALDRVDQILPARVFAFSVRLNY